MTRLPYASNYTMSVRNATLICTRVVTDECIQTFTPFGCLSQEFKKWVRSEWRCKHCLSVERASAKDVELSVSFDARERSMQRVARKVVRLSVSNLKVVQMAVRQVCMDGCAAVHPSGVRAVSGGVHAAVAPSLGKPQVLQDRWLK
jgi:hypothetical protein